LSSWLRLLPQEPQFLGKEHAHYAIEEDLATDLIEVSERKHGIQRERKHSRFKVSQTRNSVSTNRASSVSAQTIYNWEHEVARPRSEQLAKLAALRGTGKREAAQRLKELLTANR
jgi:hypothetical protein